MLAAQVTDARDYAAPDSDAIPTTLSPEGQSATADLCQMSCDGLPGILEGTARCSPPGPELGRLHLGRVLGQGYQVTNYTPC